MNTKSMCPKCEHEHRFHVSKMRACTPIPCVQNASMSTNSMPCFLFCATPSIPNIDAEKHRTPRPIWLNP